MSVKKILVLSMVLSSIVGTTKLSFAAVSNNSKYSNTVEETIVNSLRVRTTASTSSTIKATLAKGKDVIAGDVSSQKWITSGSTKRLWRTYAFPSLSEGKYDNSVRGWLCSIENDVIYIDETEWAKITKNGGSHLYMNESLTSKAEYYPNGTSLHARGIEENAWNGFSLAHSDKNINAWAVSPKNNDGIKKRWIDGWWANAH